MSVNKEVKKISVRDIIKLKHEQKPVTMLTAYDYITAKLVDESGCDITLVGDSLNMVFAGEKSTVTANMQQMLYHTKVVSSTVKRSLLVSDMPFLSFQVSENESIKNAGDFLRAGAEAVKIEGGKRNFQLIRKLTDIGIPVMGHLGLTPQSVNTFGGYYVQGKEDFARTQLLNDAKGLEESGCFSIVLEKIPAKLAQEISQSISIPTIGIGAGPHCDGQVLVTEDMLGLFDDFKPKFVRRYNNLAEQIRVNIKDFLNDIRNKNFPNESESY